jgi:ferredoxin
MEVLAIGIIVLLVVIIGLILFLERGQLLRSSTIQFLRDSGWRRFRNGTFLHSYIYGRFTKEYIGYAMRTAMPKMTAREKRGVANHYHGKVLPTELAQAIVTHEHDLALRDLEQVIPYRVARDLVLKGPPDIAVFDCPCRQTREHPCEPKQVCMVVGQPFVDFIVEHNPDTSRRLTPVQAAQLLQEEHERGHVHTAYFKDAMLNRFYAICNCCKCCCGGIEAMMKHGVPMITSSGYVAQVNEVMCGACGTCEETCAFDAVRVNGHSQIIWDKCMGCGACEAKCPNDAIALVRDELKGIPLDVRAMV